MDAKDLAKLRFQKNKRTPSDMSYDELRNLVQSIIDIYEDRTDTIERHDCVYDELYINALVDI